MENGPNETLRIEGLYHHFGVGDTRTPTLININLAIRPGELVILTGPSGSGKTTLLTLIGGLRKVQEGSLRVLGREISGLDDAQLVRVRRDIGFIFQSHNLFESLTALQNVRMALELKPFDPGAMNERATQALQEVGLGHRIKYRPKGLSGGQRQRVAIARALVNKPRLVLADEPTAALDTESTGVVMDLLDRLKRDGGTILVVTHDTKILGRADRIIGMADNRIKSNVTSETFAICQFLKNCPVFDALGAEELASMASKMKRERFPAGTTVIRQGEEGSQFFIIGSGKADVIISDQSGEHRVSVRARGEYFGEVSLLEDKPRNATVRAIEDLEVYTLDKASFREAIASAKTFEQQLRELFSRRQ